MSPVNDDQIAQIALARVAEQMYNLLLTDPHYTGVQAEEQNTQGWTVDLPVLGRTPDIHLDGPQFERA